jgi:hypothetical protein
MAMKLCCVFVACFAQSVLGSQADYYDIEGAYVTSNPGQGLLPLGHCNVVPGFHNQGGTCQDCNNSILGPDVDLFHNNNYLTNKPLPEDVMLELADLIGAERVGLAGDGHGNWLVKFPRTNPTASKQTLHIHNIRCGKGETGHHVATDKNIYKKCPGNHQLVVNNTFHLPPQLCLKTCDEEAACTGYITDETGAACTILTAPPALPPVPPDFPHQYFLMGTSTNTSTKKQKQENKKPSGQALQSSNNYFPIEGAYFGPGKQGQCTFVFGKNRGPGCSSYPTPEIDWKVQVDYPFPVLPEKLLLALADVNQAEAALHFLHDDANSVFSNALSWLPRTNSTASKQTTFVHKTRCANGVTGTTVTTAKNVYKKCSNVATDLVLKNSFNLPPSVCQQTCDHESFCVGYTIDETGSGCWILQQATNGRAQQEEFASYWLIGSS